VEAGGESVAAVAGGGDGVTVGVEAEDGRRSGDDGGEVSSVRHVERRIRKAPAGHVSPRRHTDRLTVEQDLPDVNRSRHYRRVVAKLQQLLQSTCSTSSLVSNLGVNYPNWVMGPLDLGKGLFFSMSFLNRKIFY